MDAKQLQERTKVFALRVIRLVNALPPSRAGRVLGDQAVRSATSVAANYRAACRARSRAAMIAKLDIVLEEADETHFWLELISESALLPSERLVQIIDEANQLVAIFVASLKTLRRKE